jgi:hypothetical protein
MSAAGGETITERYARGALSVARGDFPVSFDELPDVATAPIKDFFGPDDQTYINKPEKPVHHWLERKNRWLDPPYKHLAWWAYQAFCSEAQAVPLGSATDYRYFNPAGGAGVLGFLQMSRHLSNITFAYEQQITGFHPKPETYNEQAEEIASVALASFGDLRTIAEQTPAVSGMLEKNADHRPDMLSWNGPNSERANHILKLTDDDGTIAARIKNLDSQVEGVQRSFERDVDDDLEDPQRKIGCFALKVATGDEMENVLFSIWHGTVLAAKNHPEVIETQLKDMQAYVDEYGYYKTRDIVW